MRILERAKRAPLPPRLRHISYNVVEEYRLAPAKSKLALAQEEGIAAEAPAVGDDDAFCATFGDLDLGGNGVGLVQDARSTAVGDASQSSRVGEDRSSPGEVRARCIPARE
jgi:hypothetical protein